MPSQCKKRLWRHAAKNCGVIGTRNPKISYGYNCANYADDEFGEVEFLQAKRERSRSPTHPALPPNSVMTTFASSASNLIRKCCCGVNIFNSNSSNNSNNSEKMHQIANSQDCDKNATSLPILYRNCFELLMKAMNSSQIKKLCLTIENPQKGGDCILITPTTILGEEPHVTTYRLFFNKRINASQLKRLPHCLSEHNPNYVCCNPLHLGRILETDIAPPPYQRAANESKDFSFNENSQEEENSNTRSIEKNTFSSQEMSSNNRVPITESLPTDGEGRRSDASVWCKVAYWELKDRVGDIHLARKSSVNICLKSAYCNKEVSEEVSLHNLASTKRTPTPGEVEITREKIGLGIALSDEQNGVWLYNRSMQPIFVHSPTLCASWFQVCKVMPGQCLIAFDYQRARELKDPSQLPGAQAGPVDKYSMRISFVKGYGQTYKRQDLTQCPCWLEVHFTNVGR